MTEKNGTPGEMGVYHFKGKSFREDIKRAKVRPRVLQRKFTSGVADELCVIAVVASMLTCLRRCATITK